MRLFIAKYVLLLSFMWFIIGSYIPQSHAAQNTPQITRSNTTPPPARASHKVAPPQKRSLFQTFMILLGILLILVAIIGMTVAYSISRYSAKTLIESRTP